MTQRDEFEQWSKAFIADIKSARPPDWANIAAQENNGTLEEVWSKGAWVIWQAAQAPLLERIAEMEARDRGTESLM